ASRRRTRAGERRSHGPCLEPLRRCPGDRRCRRARLHAGRGIRGMTNAFRLSGLKLQSDLDLPALPPWDGPEAAPADVVIRLGKVPSRLDRPDHIAPIFQTGGGAYLLALPGTGRILVRNGKDVTVEPEAGADMTVASAI